MMKRAGASDFGGMYVFPGGKLDLSDEHAEVTNLCVGLSDADASERIGIARGGLAYWIAAVRECFEECGVLFAYRADGGLIAFSPNDTSTPASNAMTRAQSLLEVCRAHDLRLALDRIEYFSHWITPEGPPRRYDTRFFITRAAADHVGEHDQYEAVASVWVRPEKALANFEHGHWQMISPTLSTLAAISGHRCVDDLLQRVRARRHLPAWDEERGRQGMQRTR